MPRHPLFRRLRRSTSAGSLDLPTLADPSASSDDRAGTSSSSISGTERHEGEAARTVPDTACDPST